MERSNLHSIFLTSRLLRSYGILLMAGIVGATPLMKRLGNRLAATKTGPVLEPVLLAVALVLCVAYLVDGSFNPFLYFRF